MKKLTMLAILFTAFALFAEEEGSLDAEAFRFYQDLRASITSYTITLSYNGTHVEQWSNVPDPSTSSVYISGIAPKVYDASLYAMNDENGILFWAVVEADFTSGHADIAFVLRANEKPWYENADAGATSTFEYMQMLNTGFSDSFGADGAVAYENIPLRQGKEVRFYSGSAKKIDVYRYSELVETADSNEITFTPEYAGGYTFIATGNPNYFTYTFME